jgi:hypothetical protein
MFLYWFIFLETRHDVFLYWDIGWEYMIDRFPEQQ